MKKQLKPDTSKIEKKIIKYLIKKYGPFPDWTKKRPSK